MNLNMDTETWADPNYSEAMHRYRAVELSIRCIEGFETPETIVKRAKAFAEFIIEG